MSKCDIRICWLQLHCCILLLKWTEDTTCLFDICRTARKVCLKRMLLCAFGNISLTSFTSAILQCIALKCHKRSVFLEALHMFSASKNCKCVVTLTTPHFWGEYQKLTNPSGLKAQEILSIMSADRPWGRVFSTHTPGGQKKTTRSKQAETSFSVLS